MQKQLQPEKKASSGGQRFKGVCWSHNYHQAHLGLRGEPYGRRIVGLGTGGWKAAHKGNIWRRGSSIPGKHFRESSEALEARKSRSWYSMGSPKAKVRLEDGSKLTALLDTCAKINVMTKEVMEDAGLAMRRGPKLELVSHTGHSRPFLGLCEDVEVAIGGLKTRHHIFVVETGDHDLVLGQPFLNSVKFSQEYKPDGIFGAITHPYTHQSAVFRTLASQDPANQKENRIFSQTLN